MINPRPRKAQVIAEPLVSKQVVCGNPIFIATKRILRVHMKHYNNSSEVFISVHAGLDLSSVSHAFSFSVSSVLQDCSLHLLCMFTNGFPSNSNATFVRSPTSSSGSVHLSLCHALLCLKYIVRMHLCLSIAISTTPGKLPESWQYPSQYVRLYASSH